MSPGTRDFRELPVLGFACGVTWAIGTNWISEAFYPIRGISWGDLLFVGWLLFALAGPKRRAALGTALRELRMHNVLLTALAALLLAATAINGSRFGVEVNNLLAICRLFYLSVIVAFTYMLVQREGYTAILFGFLVGVGLLTLDQMYDAEVSGAVIVQGVMVLRDPNVIGNMIGVGVAFCSLGILAGYVRLSLIIAAALAIASVETFSKGTWLMVIIGLFANAVAWVMLYRRTRQSFRRFLPMTILVVAVLGGLVYANFDVLSNLVSYKIFTTYASETLADRYRFALAATNAMADYPLWGLGFGNFAAVEKLYPAIITEPTENAHNVFMQIGAVGGLPALGVLLALFLYPFAPLSRAVRTLLPTQSATLLVALIFVVFVLSGAVQLQLIAQPFFWVFTGITLGWYARLGGQTSQEAAL